ncbi:hypothetical protein RDABS01_009718 [Bienertia sinuspersici]
MSRLQQISSNLPDTITLPDHLIVDHILPTLPVKSLVRFKPVSKFWLCVISNPEFAKSHLKSYLPSFHQCLVVTVSNKGNNNLKPLLKWISIFFQFFNVNIILILWVIAMVCLVCIVLLLSRLSSPFAILLYISFVQSITLILKIVFLCFIGLIGKWKRIQDCDSVDDRLSNKTTVINDILYWSPIHLNRRHCIYGFDLVNEKLIEFPLLDWLNGYSEAIFFYIQWMLVITLSFTWSNM